MSEHKYDRLANILIVVAIASALLFDSGKFSHVIVGAIGGVAGALAVALYFVNQRHGAAAKQEESVRELSAKAGAKLAEKFAVSMSDPARKYADLWEAALGHHIERYAIEAYRRETAHLYASHPSAIHHVGHSVANYWYMVDTRRALQQTEITLTPNDVAACAIEIIRHLSSGEDRERWEFSFGPNGLRISSRRGQPQRPTVSQEDFDFGQISPMVQ